MSQYNLVERTPEELRCGGIACPAIYETLVERTPQEMDCLIGTCSRIYEASNRVYLVIGKQIDPKEAGLAEKVGEGEALIEIPKGLLANIK